MATVPVPYEMDSGPVTAAPFNAGVRDVLRFLLGRPMAELVQTVAQTLTTSVWGTITFDAEQLDLPNLQHDNVTSNSKFTAAYPGWYVLGGGVAFAANSAGLRGLRWVVNGTVVDASEILIPPTTTIGTIVPARCKRVYLDYGSYVELQGFQSSGGNLATSITAEVESSMSVAWERNVS